MVFNYYCPGCDKWYQYFSARKPKTECKNCGAELMPSEVFKRPDGHGKLILPHGGPSIFQPPTEEILLDHQKVAPDRDASQRLLQSVFGNGEEDDSRVPK
jgi:hypothetical protein